MVTKLLLVAKTERLEKFPREPGLLVFGWELGDPFRSPEV